MKSDIYSSTIDVAEWSPFAILACSEASWLLSLRVPKIMQLNVKIMISISLTQKCSVHKF